MRDYSNFARHYESLLGDTYPQPSDKGHTAWASDAIHNFEIRLLSLPRNLVLDVGCGDGFCRPMLEEAGLQYVGQDLNIGVDFNFLPDGNNTFGMMFARHVLEHSPMPLITLMEWRRVVKDGGYLFLIMPSPEFWKIRGKNHYSVFPKGNIEWWLQRAGWHTKKYMAFTNHSHIFLENSSLSKSQKKTVLAKAAIPIEYRWLCEAGEAIKE